MNVQFKIKKGNNKYKKLVVLLIKKKLRYNLSNIDWQKVKEPKVNKGWEIRNSLNTGAKSKPLW